MIEKIISFSIRNKLVIGFMTLVLIAMGIYSMKNIPLDATPDITNNQVQVITVSPNLGTEDIEKFVTYPVELSMSNLPNVNEIRSVSRFGLSVVTIVFKEDMGTYLPRQLVGEALGEISGDIPDEFGKPFMAPISTGLGEIYQYVLEVDPKYENKYDARKLRTIQEWIVKRQMSMTPGVVEVNSFGGYSKQYEIAVNPDKLKSMNISMSELYSSIEGGNQNTGGAYIEKNHKTNYIRGEGLARSIEDIKKIVVKVIEDRPILVGDIAKVKYGNAIRYGAFTRNGKGEAVGGIVMMLKGANSNEVINNIKDRVKKIQKSLPKGVKIVPFLDRSEMIKDTTSTVAENLGLGALIVIFVLILILGNIRGGFIVASTIPLSLLFAFIMMWIFDVWANLMSLGAIDFGILIDGAVIIVECMIFYLYDKKYIGTKLTISTRNKLAHKASSSMMRSAFFGQVIIMIVFIPIMVLGGIEGKMFKPMALTFSFAVLGVLILCLTYVPMMSALFLRAPKNNKPTVGDKIVRRVENFYRPIVRIALKRYKIILLSASTLLLFAVFLFSKMGGEFIPQLDEGNVAMHMLLKPGTSLTDVVGTATKVEKRLIDKFSDEIESIQTRIGVADIPTDPMPVDIGDCFIILKPKSKWKVTKDKETLISMFKSSVSEIPGVNYEFSQPVEMRFNELLTGVREDLAIKIFGEDLDVLALKASEIEKLISKIPGVGDLRAEATKGLPQITIEYDRERVARYGLKIKDLNTLVETAFSGLKAGVLYEGEKKFDIVLRLQKSSRTSINDVRNIYVSLSNGSQVPLSELAHISYKPGPMQISRENTNRRIYVGVNVRGRDIKSLVKDIQVKLDENLNLPPGYYIRYGGAFENLERATNRLKVVVPIALLIIFLLVFMAIKSFRQTLMIYIAIPLAAIGGIISLYLRDMPFSISAGVGFIVLFGVAVMNGLVLISGFNELRSSGDNYSSLKDIIIKGSIRRIRPILLTASTDILGFLPMAISTSAGAEVQRPLATVVIGGMFTATLLTLVVLPVLYNLIEKRKFKTHR
ncbi:MAG: CusA/CzcA family heavy metal efflux RND transporter [Marinifilaceae bacterium]|jgi:cobalt-zinc-cadmium resistance protein CzcA|nr:CusA/CzcA family heavy metal efflux RND transporter [Marinifilaceae bacterium]